eukprot:m.124487 g.124487  ORF g.124487 m.124487 type:complete len:261 (+) comp17293_c0_seq1:235-1017(+)
MFSRTILCGYRRTGAKFWNNRGPITQRAALATSSTVNSNVRAAVVLAGNGVYDGSEITEAVSTLVHLSRYGASVKCFAPNREQAHVVDHSRGEEMQPSRNVLVESARIARGDITALGELTASDFDVLVIPGGFGAAKNLCDWAFKETGMSIEADVHRVIEEFHGSKKPMAMCCISPVLAAKAIPGVRITLGKSAGVGWPYAGTIDGAVALGAVHVECDIQETCVDETNLVVTSPAYMFDGKPHEIFDSVGKMVDDLFKLT